MMIKKFLAEDQGVVTVEYVIFVAVIGVTLAAGVWVLFNGMSALFSAWTGYFATG